MVNSSQKSQTETISPIFSSHNLGWDSIIVQEFEVYPLGTAESCLWQEHSICMSLTNCHNRIWQAIDSRSYLGLYTKGDLTVIPATLTSSYEAFGDDRYLQIRIPSQFLKQVATETINTDPDRLELATEFRTRNSKIEQLAMMIRAELHQGDRGIGQLYIESLANALVVNLLRDYSGTKPQIAIYEGGLGDRSLLKVTDYINDRLTQSIKIKDLAKFLGISQFHFSRLFKQSIGISPHQYVMQQRIELAKRLLKKADRSISDIALDCGFNSHSHFGKYFRALTGMTPKEYRQNR